MKRAQEAAVASAGTTQRNRLPLSAFFLGSVISYVGDTLTLLAIPWFVLQTTGSVTQTGITAFFSVVPMALSAFFGSALVDRLGYKRTSVIGDLASGLTVVLIPLLYSTVGLAFWHLLALVFLGGLLKSPGVTARFSLLPDLAESAQMPLARANALTEGVYRVSSFLGAPLAAVLITFIGASNLLWFDAASFGCSALLIGLGVPATPPLMQAGAGVRRYLAEVWESVRFLERDALLLTIVLTALITNLLDGAPNAVVEPAYIKSIFHSPLPLGLLLAALGGATFVGTLIFGAIGQRFPRRLTFGLGITLNGVLRFWGLLVPIIPVLLVLHAIAGLVFAPVNPLIDTVLQERVPAEMRARVFGTASAGVLVGIPLGTVASGYLVAWVGLQLTLEIMGALYLVTALSLLIHPALRQMGKPMPLNSVM